VHGTGSKKLTDAGFSISGVESLNYVTIEPFGKLQKMQGHILIKLDDVFRAGQVSGQRTYQAPSATRRRNSCKVHSSEIQ
jgi:hypothetical protein